ncbi:MAG: glycosyltransferase family 2 protein [Halioglobus sp.]
MLAVVIPCFKSSRHIVGVINAIGDEVDRIIVVDDHCPESGGKLVEQECHDPRIEVIYHEKNLGVGGAVKTGYRRAHESGADIVVKIDSDGQMDPDLIPLFVQPLVNGEADYTKGNRFFEAAVFHQMPKTRLIGNLGLSFLTKLSSGYWSNFDPTNGYTAISTKLIPLLPLDKIDNRYFFESDMMFRLNTIRAVVIDIPMDAVYGDEVSNLSPRKVIRPFFEKNLGNLGKRIAYNYFGRDFNYASIELIFGLILTGFGFIYGSVNWISNILNSTVASAGTVMLSGLTVIIGIQMLLGFLQYDMSNVPRTPLQSRLSNKASIT